MGVSDPGILQLVAHWNLLISVLKPEGREDPDALKHQHPFSQGHRYPPLEDLALGLRVAVIDIVLEGWQGGL